MQDYFEKRSRDDAFDDDDDDKKGRRKIKIEYIEDKSRRHITFSKRKAGIMKKAYELSTLTGTQVLLLVASETGHVYTFATPKLQPLITKPEGKDMIQKCLNAPDIQRSSTPSYTQYQPSNAPSPGPSRPVSSMSMKYPDIGSPKTRPAGEAEYAMNYPTMYNSAGLPLSPQMMYQNVANPIPQDQYAVQNNIPPEQFNVQNTLPQEPYGVQGRMPQEQFNLQNTLPQDQYNVQTRMTEQYNVQNGLPREQFHVQGRIPQEQYNVQNGLQEQFNMQNRMPQEYNDPNFQKELQGLYYPMQPQYFRRSMTPGDVPSRSMTPLDIPTRSLTPQLDMNRIDMRMPHLDMSRLHSVIEWKIARNPESPKAEVPRQGRKNP